MERQAPRFRGSERRRFRRQSFRSLAKRSADVGLPFTDPQFRPQDRSVFQTSQFRSLFNIGRLVWKRPKQLLEENECGQQHVQPALMAPMAGHSGRFVGFSPNTWMMAAALAVAQHRCLLEQLVQVDEERFREQGIVRLTIWQMGLWHKVVVDDRLPCSGSKPIFAQPILSQPCCGCCCWWLPMLEKAYAKLHGSYEALATDGSLHGALMDFTGGGSVETISTGSCSSRQLAELISKEFQAKSLLVIKTKEYDSAESVPFGLVPSRFYLITNVKKPASTLKRLLSSSQSSNYENLPVAIMNTMADTTKTKANAGGTATGKCLQELWIISNIIPQLFDTLTICRPYQYHKDQIRRMVVTKPPDGGLQFRFDVGVGKRPPLPPPQPPPPPPQQQQINQDDVRVQVTLSQRTGGPIAALGFRIYAIERNRQYRVHHFGSLALMATVDPVQSRHLIAWVRLPAGARYLLKPICPDIAELSVSLYATAAGQLDGLQPLTLDMPRYQLLSFMTPSYPVAMTRITVVGAEGLRKQDRFGSANPYCIIRCGTKYVKSTVQYETLAPRWQNLSAIFYHRHQLEPISVQIWHRSLLVDYFVGTARIEPQAYLEREDVAPTPIAVSTPGSGSSVDSPPPDYSQVVGTFDTAAGQRSPSSIVRVPLTDTKGLTQRDGFILFHMRTVEDLKRF